MKTLNPYNKKWDRSPYLRIALTLTTGGVLGTGLAVAIAAMPDPWQIIAIVVLLTVAFVFSCVQLRWSRDMQRKLADDLRRLDTLAKDEP